MPSEHQSNLTAIRSLCRRRSVRGLLAAQFISVAGDYAYMVGLGVWLWDSTGSAFWVSASVFARMIPRLILGRWAGALADRFERRRLLISLDVARGALTALLALMMAKGIHPATAVALTALVGVVTTPYGPATVKFLGEIVESNDRVHLNTAYEFSAQLAVFVGPTIATAILMVSSAPWAVVCNAASFFLAACLVRLLPEARPLSWNGRNSGPQNDVSSRVVLDDRRLRALAFVVFLQTAHFGFEQAALPLLADGLGSAAGSGVGALFASIGLGGLLAAPIATKVGRSHDWAAVLAVTLSAEAIGIGLLAFGVPVSIALSAMVLAGAARFCFEVVVLTALQEVVPPERFGAVYGTLGAVSAAGVLCGATVLPLMIKTSGLHGTTITYAVVTLTAGVLVLRRCNRPNRRHVATSRAQSPAQAPT